MAEEGMQPGWKHRPGATFPVRRLPELDARLLTAYEMIPCSALCADIGADHGRLSAALLASGRAQEMLVADISPKALARAEQRLTALGLASYATFAVADGLDALGDRQADAICILGMGGETVAGILCRGRERLGNAELVLSGQTELPALRQAVNTVGYRLREERAVLDGRRNYILMRATRAEPSEPADTERELWLGKCLLETLPPQWKPMLERRERMLANACGAMRQADLDKDRQRLAEALRELGYIRETLARYGGQG